MSTRTVILHYHLFKNAGTSVDQALAENFHEKWLTKEFPVNGDSNAPLVAEWIAQSNAVAYSSHTAMGPLIQLPQVRVLPLLFLRDPIERIKSAYRFERSQKADTYGAILAKELDFEGYVRARLGKAGDRQCADFQTHRLATLVAAPGSSELERAKLALRRLFFVGRVEDFDASMSKLMRKLKTFYPEFTYRPVHKNSSTKSDSLCSGDFLEFLLGRNQKDIELLRELSNLEENEIRHDLR